MVGDAQKVKDALDIVEVVGSYVTLKKAGSTYKGLCPFHDERTPSMMVNPERQIFKCFGCSEGGDVITFIEKIENLEFGEALQLLARRAGVTLTPFTPTFKYTTNQNQEVGSKNYEENISSDNKTDYKSVLYRINTLSTSFYHKILVDHPAGEFGRNYLDSRGVDSATIKKFHIGYAPDRNPLGQTLIKKGFSQSQLHAAGSPEKFRDRIIFPIFDPIGNVVGFTGRLLNSQKLEDTSRLGPKYFNSPETAIFHKQAIVYGLSQARDAIRKNDYVVLVEGQMDVVASHLAGVEQVVASSGTAITQTHLKRLSRMTERLVLAFDGDEAGYKATLSALTMALPLGFTTKVVVLPEGIKDAGEAIEKDPNVWKQAIKDAPYALDWLVSRGFGDLGLSESAISSITPEQKRKIVKLIAPYLALISDSIEQAHFVGQLSHKLGIPEDAILQKMNQGQDRDSRISSRDEVVSNPETTHSLPLSAQLYGLLVVYPSIKDKYLALYNSLDKMYSDKQSQIVASITGSYGEMSLASAQVEVDVLRGRLKSDRNDKTKGEFAQMIAAAEASGDRDQVKELLKQLQELTKSK